MIADLNAMIDKLRLEADNTSAIIIRSSLEKVFSAGADLKERLSMKEEEVAPFVASLRVFTYRKSNLTTFCVKYCT